MGLAIIMIALLSLLVGLLFLPRVVSYIDVFVVDHPFGASWGPLEHAVLLLPFLFLILVFFGAFKAVSKL